MLRTSRILHLAAVSVVLCLSTQAADAAPLTLSLEDYDQLVGVIQIEKPSGSSAAESEPVENPPQANQQPSPQDAMLPSGSTTGSSPSSISPGGGPSSAITSPIVAYQPVQVRHLLDKPGSLLIPPRFLDGVFRPPRVNHSL